MEHDFLVFYSCLHLPTTQLLPTLSYIEFEGNMPGIGYEMNIFAQKVLFFENS